MAERYRSVLLFGPPGVGKGTQGKLLGQIPGMFHLATGDIFRALDRESELGRQFLHYSSRGELVPDDLTLRVWQDYMEKQIAAGEFNAHRDLLLLDGIPRSRKQATMIDEHVDVLRIIYLSCPDVDEMIQRMKRRARNEGRHDDADESVIRRRFDVFEKETAPVLAHYPDELVAEVNAVGSPAEVLHRILGVLVPIYKEHFGNPLGGEAAPSASSGAVAQ